MDIKKLIDTDYLTEIRNNRRGNGQLGKLNKKTQEFFTPYSIVKKTAKIKKCYIDENGNEVWMRPSNKSQHHPN